MQGSNTQVFWGRAVAAVARRVNSILWAEKFAPLLFGVGAAAAVAVFALRRLHGPVAWGWWVLLAGVAAAAFVAWRRARRGFFSRADARVFLEYQLGLDAGLSAAEAGVSAWPAAGGRGEDGPGGILRYRVGALAGWTGGAAALLLAGAWLPVPESAAGPVRFWEKPPALAQTEAWLEELAKMEMIDRSSVESLEQRARELAGRPLDEQYSHSALEAADALRRQTEGAMDGLAKHFDTVAGTMRALGDTAARDALTDGQLREMDARLDAALHGLRDGELTAGGGLAEALRGLEGLDPSQLKTLSPEEAAALGRKLAQAGHVVRGVKGAAGGNGEKAWVAGEGEGEPDAVLLVPGQGGDGALAAAGGGSPARGRGDAPLTFSDRKSDVGPGRAQTVRNDDFSRAALGDRIGTRQGEHEIDPAAMQGLTNAGGVAGAAQGGEAVWVDRLTPAEREALKEFFK
ncbi:hypothetical protein AW736_13575 [Termitidicoccus mucosus]|uniref:Uncharacterized protein n=2 Tax=Termitidicoccus mucosus TaxID=1184151 RepID=A0A178IH11_9BACT|nr:hypothetical protein AW736_13575 [Opitutaceae bacterium TSB47]